MLLDQVQESVAAALLACVQDGQYRRYVGPHSDALVAGLCNTLALEQCVLASSGTACLEIALRAARVGSGDRVLISAYDYPGNFWAIERVGARPVLVDTETGGWSIDARGLENGFAAAKNCKALVASHLHGQLQNAAELRQWADSKQLLFVEDCCQAIGANCGDVTAGSLGHVAIVSFGGGKLLSAGRGGALLSNDEVLMQKCRLAAGAGSGPYALSEMQAAVVAAQLRWLPELLAATRRYFGDVAQALSDLQQGCEPDRRIAFLAEASQASFYQAGFVLPPAVDQSAAPTRLESLVTELRSQGIPAGAGFSGFHRRSTRRCDQPMGLNNSMEIVPRTLVIHHHAAFQDAALQDAAFQDAAFQDAASSNHASQAVCSARWLAEQLSRTNSRLRV